MSYHCDYILLGSEIHIDMVDDRLEIQSPGGMYDGRAIQDRDIHTIASARRNPVIADLFNRMKFMERHGSGLTKILSETAKLPGYDERLKPGFFSTPSDFRMVLKSVNYSTLANTAQVAAQDDRMETLIEFCSIPRSRDEMHASMGIEHREYFRKAFLKPLLEAGIIEMTQPDEPSSPVKNMQLLKHSFLALLGQSMKKVVLLH